jgi:hypothetical protein
MVAWVILALAESLHCNGPSVFVSFDKHFWKKVEKTKLWTFAKRLEKTIALLSTSKARCGKLLAGVDLQAVVAVPEKLLKRTRSNVIQNGKWQRVWEAGRAAKKMISIDWHVGWTPTM